MLTEYKDITKPLYMVTVADVQHIAEDIFSRKLTQEEVDMVANEIGHAFDWTAAVRETLENMFDIHMG